ncbi:MAG: DUF5343 domain-containing protein [Bacteroidota bacterium]|nr:DUF5343 domain-containing protein [Bacteroidota bacterium]
MKIQGSYTYIYNLFGDFFSKIKEHQIPKKFTINFLNDLGYKSNNHRDFISLLKNLGFLTRNGCPTLRYYRFQSDTNPGKIMSEAIIECYTEIFLIRPKPALKDKTIIESVLKNYHNLSDLCARLLVDTFYSLLDLSDINSYENNLPEREGLTA